MTGIADKFFSLTTELSLADTGTPLQFVTTSDKSLACGSKLVDSTDGFLIVKTDGDTTGSDCLKTDLTYSDTEVATTCDGMGFYFSVEGNEC